MFFHVSLLLFTLLILFILVFRSMLLYKGVKESTVDNSSKYTQWLLSSFLAFGLYGVFILLCLNGALPKNSASAVYYIYLTIFKTFYTDAQLDITNAIPLFFGFTIGLIVILFSSRSIIGRRFFNTDAIVTLRPKTRKEAVILIIMCINAGISEEIMFRAALPDLFYSVTRLPLLSVLLSCFIFGLAHWYQGIRGILATLLLALIFSVIISLGFSLYVVMAAHFLTNIFALFVIPKVSQFSRKKR